MPAYFVDESSEDQTSIVYQPDVYSSAAELARILGVARLIDIGCGRGGKLQELKNDFEITGIDYGANIEYCRKSYQFGQWLNVDLEKNEPIPELSDRAVANSIILSSDVIEHLIHPHHLVARIRNMLKSSKLAVISTPDRLLLHGALHYGPPVNPFHVREWSLREFQYFLRSEGISVAYAGLTRSHNQSDEKRTCLIVAISHLVTETELEQIRRALPPPPPLLQYYHQVLRKTIASIGG